MEGKTAGRLPFGKRGTLYGLLSVSEAELVSQEPSLYCETIPIPADEPSVFIRLTSVQVKDTSSKKMKTFHALYKGEVSLR